MASSVLTVACILLLMSTFAECQNLSCYDVGDTNTELGRCNVQLGRGECKGSCNSLLKQFADECEFAGENYQTAVDTYCTGMYV